MKENQNREARLEALEDALDELTWASEEGVPLLVEGDKDEAALRVLGIRGPIVKVHAGRGLFAFVEDLSREHRAAVLLTDWDSRGGRLAKRLREACQANGVALDESHRLAIMRATRGEVKTVESLDTYLVNLRANVGAPPRPIPNPDRLRRLAREEAERRERAGE